MTEPLSPIRFNYTKLETVVQKASAVEELAQQLNSRHYQSAFVMASRSLDANSGIIGQISDSLAGKVAGTFTELPAHTPRTTVLELIDIVRQSGADVLITLGGGSVIDAAKVVQLALAQDVQTEDELIQYAQFADGSRGPKAANMSLLELPSTLRQIAVPTTLSGAEFSNNAGVTDTERSLKEGYRGLDLCPQAIVYDPALSVYTPEWLWLSTAIRSLDHAVEGYCSNDSNSFLDSHFLHAMKLFAQSLPETKKDPGNLESRSLNQQAVWLACCGLGQVGHGASHGIGYLLGAVCGVPHGHTSCVMLPAVLNWNQAINGERQKAIAEALGAPELSAATAVKRLIAQLGLPTSLQQVGVKKEQLPQIAELSCKHPVVRKNPRPVEGPEHVMEMLELAWE